MNLLDRAKKMLQGQGASASHKTQYYNVLCPDGHRISGARNEGYQALRCPSCGEGVFILPRSPLPEVPAPPRPSSRPARPSPAPAAVLDEPIALTDVPPPPPRPADEDLPEIDWEEAPEPPRRPANAPDSKPAERPTTGKQAPASPEARSAERPARSRPARTPGAPAQRPVRSAAARPKPPEADTEFEESERGFHPAEWARRHRNPLIFGSVALILAATIGLRQWRSELLDSPRIAELGRTEGIKALDQGEWDKAHQLLSRAKRAVDALGGKVQGAEEIRHAADEAALYANRLSDSLERLLALADPAEDSDWPRTFRNLYQGKAVIVIAEVASVPGVDGATEYDLNYRILPNGEGDLDRRRDVRVGRLVLSDFALFRDLQPKKGTELRFGARLRSFTFEPERNEWRVGFEPDSGVILQHQGALSAAMMTEDALSAPEESKP